METIFTGLLLRRMREPKLWHFLILEEYFRLFLIRILRVQQAMKGLGVDRHLLGLKLAAKELGIEVPKLFFDAGFVRSSHMRISTSQVIRSKLRSFSMK